MPGNILGYTYPKSSADFGFNSCESNYCGLSEMTSHTGLDCIAITVSQEQKTAHFYSIAPFSDV